MSDTPTGEDVVQEMRRQHRNMLIEKGDLIDVTYISKRMGIKPKVAVTPIFHKHFYPMAEDATKGVTFDEIMWDILKIFVKEMGNKLKPEYMFPVISKTYVKTIHNLDKVETYADGKPRDKYIMVQVFLMPDENMAPSVVLGVVDIDEVK